MANQYWLKREGKMYGPYSGGRLKELAREGKIGPEDMISADKRAWQLAKIVRGLDLSAGVKQPQATVAVSVPSPLEVSPRRRTASTGYDCRLSLRPSRSKWIVVASAGIAMVGLAVLAAVWLWTPGGESVASTESAQSNENGRSAAISPEKSGDARITPTPAAPRAAVKPPVPKKKPRPVVKPSAVRKEPPKIVAKPPDKKPVPVVPNSPTKTAAGKTPPLPTKTVERKKLPMPFSAADIDKAIAWGKPTKVVGGWRCYDVSGLTVIKARDVDGKLEIRLRNNGLCWFFIVHVFSSNLFTPVESDKILNMAMKRSSGSAETGRFSVTMAFDGDSVVCGLTAIAEKNNHAGSQAPRDDSRLGLQAKQLDSFVDVAKGISWSQAVMLKDMAETGQDDGTFATELVFMAEAIKKLGRGLPPLSSKLRYACEEVLEQSKAVGKHMYGISHLHTPNAAQQHSIQERRRLLKEQQILMAKGMNRFYIYLSILRKERYKGYPALRRQ